MSNYGPAGIYLISPFGGRPRWLCSATLFWPVRLRFSPDDRTLLAIDNYELQLIDVTTGTARKPFYTNSAVTGAEWIEHGSKLLYFRSSYDPDAPAESSWMHVLDLATGTDSHLAIDGRDLSLTSMRSGPDGRVAAIEELSTSDRLVIVDPTAGHSQVIYDTGTLRLYRNLQWWICSVIGRGDLIFEMTTYVGWTITPGQAVPVRFPQGWNPFCLMSPDGRSIVTDGTDPQTRVGVLDIASVDDVSGASHRHLTSYSQPVASVQATSP